MNQGYSAPSSSSPFSLPFARFAFTLRAAGEASLPPYLGSTLRGAMGRAFRQNACLARGNKCEHCMFRWQCAYAYVFETARARRDGEGGQEEIQPIPHPFGLEAPLDKKTLYKNGETLIFSLLLIGNGVQFLPFFISAFDQAGREGLGAARYPFHLDKVEQVSSQGLHLLWNGGWNLLAAPIVETLSTGRLPGDEDVETISLELHTPTRLVDGGSLSGDLSFTLLMRSIFRRLDLLSRAHSSGPLVIPFGQYLEQAAQVEMVEHLSNLHWQEWERYSNRQKTKLLMGGLVGQVTYQGKLAPFLPFLRLAQELHVGKGTVFGLGQVRILSPV